MIRSPSPSPLLLCIASLLAAPSAALPAEHHVFPGQSIQAAIAAAAEGDVVLVHAGTYAEAITFQGKHLDLIGVDGAQATVIDASGTNKTAVLVNEQQPTSPLLQGFTIRGGGSLGLPTAGVVASADGKARVEQCILEDNAGASGGGVVATTPSSGQPDRFVLLRDCIVRNNRANSGGGAFGGALRAVNCLFEGNSATLHGGGVRYFHAVATGPAPFVLRLENCVFRGNTAGADGGGVSISSVPPVGTGALVPAAAMDDCRFEENVAGANGGGLDVIGSSTVTIEISRCTFLRNTAPRGGGVRAGPGPLSLLPAPTIHVATNVFAGNQSGAPGAALWTRGNTNLERCTLVDNDAHGTEGTLFVRNSILRGAGPLLGSDGSPVSVSFSNVEGGWNGPGVIDVDPQFVSAADDDYHLEAGSECVDAGVGFPFMDFEGDFAVGAIDFGADEFARHLYLQGDAVPNDLFRLRVTGPPGDLVVVMISAALADPPVVTPHGIFRLAQPLQIVGAGAVPASGVVEMDGRLPRATPLLVPSHAQALVGPALTNAIRVTPVE